MQLPTEFGVGAGEVPRGGERAEKGEFARGNRRRCIRRGRRRWSRRGVAAAADAEDIEALGLRQGFVPPPTVPTSREAMETET